MCGIAGFITMGAEADLRQQVRRMADALEHRGPDDSGEWVDSETGVALGHRRLSIIDLSPAGHQPMQSASGRYIFIFNGEIYNHLALRKELEGISWRGHSDTETLLVAFEQWGIEAALQKSVGMFAFALWDRQDCALILGRDRLGEKPLYYGWQNKSFIFASELKALRAHRDFCAEIDRNVLALYLRHNYIPAPYSIYRGLYKLEPGSYMVLPSEATAGFRPERHFYWQMSDVVRQQPDQALNFEHALDQLDKVLRQSVSDQMIADVPVGAFLSGGIDSSLVVSLMQAQATRPVNSFSIGFQDEAYDEAIHARAVAKHLGCHHTELYVTPEQARDVIPRLPRLYDEPFADSSQIPTFLVSELASQHVKVSLSGDGGDELFGGYNRYFWAASLWRKFGAPPLFMRKILSHGMKSLSPGTWDRLFSVGKYGLPARLHYRNPGDKLHKLADMIKVESGEAIYYDLVSQWKNPTDLVPGATEPLTALTDPERQVSLPTFEQRMMYLDTISYLPDDIMVKVDRAAMGVSLETRMPLLDHRVVEFAWSLPLSMKIDGSEGKKLLRQLLYRYVPKELIDRPKMGFGVPIDSWLRGPLRDWAESLIDPDRLQQEGYFSKEIIHTTWQEHLSGQRNWSYQIWTILMFQLWLDQSSGIDI